MNSALIGITAGRETWDGIAASGINGFGIETAASTLFKTPVMRDGVLSGGWIVPSDGSPIGNRDSRRHIVGRAAIHEDAALRRCRVGRPHPGQEDDRYKKNASQHINILISPYLLESRPP